MQTSYSSTQSRGIPGTKATLRPSERLARTYPKVQHTVVVSLGGNDNGTYTMRVTPPSGLLPVPYYDITFAASGDSADDIVAALAAAGNQAATVPNLRNLLTATSSASDDTVTLTAVRAGEVFTVSFPSNPNTNLTQETTVNADRSALPIAVAVVGVPGVDDQIDLPSGSTVEKNVLGVVMRSRLFEAPLDNSTESIPVGETCEVAADEDIYLMPEDDVDVDDDVHVRIASDGATEILGAIRGTPSGTAQASTVTPVADQAQYGFELGWRGQHYSAVYQPTDGTTTVADAIDGLFDAIGGASGITGLTIAETDTELTITTPAGEQLDYLRNTHWNADTEAASTVVALGTADVETLIMTRWKWLKAGGPTSGEVAILQVKP